MPDPYIDQFETQAYGPFTVSQITNLVLGLMPDFDSALKASSRLLEESTKTMGEVLGEDKNLSGVTFKAVSETETDPVTQGRELLDQLASYALSRKKSGDKTGKQLAKEILKNESISIIKRRRPVKLIGYLSQALTVVQDNRKQLDPEADTWIAELQQAIKSLSLLIDRIKKAKTIRQDMKPEVRAAYTSWHKVYRAAKLQVEAVLLLCDKIEMMSLVFDDLAEVHQVSGVSDGSDPDETTPSAADPPAAPAAPNP